MKRQIDSPAIPLNNKKIEGKMNGVKHFYSFIK